MDGFSLTLTTQTPVFTNRTSFPSLSRTLVSVFPQKNSNFTVYSSRDEPKLDPLDQMELKFGRMIGEDPKLTLAKILGRKANPEASYMDIEKSFYKNKGKIVEIKEVPFGVSKSAEVSEVSRPMDTKRVKSSPLDGLNLARPVPKKGVKFEVDDRPRGGSERVKKLSRGVVEKGVKGSVPNVILRKPSLFSEDDVEDARPRLRIKPNLSLKMRIEQPKERFSDMTLLRKPELVMVDGSSEQVQEKSDSNVGNGFGDMGFTLLEKPKASVMEKIIEREKFEQEETSVIGNTDGFNDLSKVAAMNYIRRPSLDESKDSLLSNIQSQTDDYLKGLHAHKESSMEVTEEHEVSKGNEADWIVAEELVKTGNKGDVELISASTRGFVVSFCSLVGFLPYRNLAFKWKFIAFESWLRRKGLDPSLYRRNLGIIGTYDVTSKINPSLENEAIVIKNEGEITLDMKLDELLGIYDQEKIKFLSSFIGQKVKVNVVLANKRSGKLVFSVKPKENEESLEKKRSLMTKLQVGDVVKCCIKKISYFGVFVEVEGVPALIHQSEISWDATVDPSSYFKIGQTLEAKVHQLDFALERIFLSLKEIMSDPLMKTLESVVGDNQTLDRSLKAEEADTKWDDVESLFKELEQTEGIQSVSKGRFFLSPGLAPTFQVYMASMFENQYKLLARSENKVQEVIVQTSLDKEEMKSVILRCTSRVG